MLLCGLVFCFSFFRDVAQCFCVPAARDAAWCSCFRAAVGLLPCAPVFVVPQRCLCRVYPRLCSIQIGVLSSLLAHIQVGVLSSLLAHIQIGVLSSPLAHMHGHSLLPVFHAPASLCALMMHTCCNCQVSKHRAIEALPGLLHPSLHSYQAVQLGGSLMHARSSVS